MGTNGLDLMHDGSLTIVHHNRNWSLNAFHLRRNEHNN